MGIEEIMPVPSVFYRHTFAEILAKLEEVVHALDSLVLSWPVLMANIYDLMASEPNLTPSVSMQALGLHTQF